MRISAKVDYAVRALCELAAHQGDAPLKAEEIARAQEIPLSFLENILVDLRRAGFVRSLRGLGIGEQMIDAMIEKSRARGCKQLQLTTNKRRIDAQRFYRRLGFEASHEGMKLDL